LLQAEAMEALLCTKEQTIGFELEVFRSYMALYLHDFLHIKAWRTFALP